MIRLDLIIWKSTGIYSLRQYIWEFEAKYLPHSIPRRVWRRKRLVRVWSGTCCCCRGPCTSAWVPGCGWRVAPHQLTPCCCCCCWHCCCCTTGHMSCAHQTATHLSYLLLRTEQFTHLWYWEKWLSFPHSIHSVEGVNKVITDWQYFYSECRVTLYYLSSLSAECTRYFELEM